jgi:hypothetical protein
VLGTITQGLTATAAHAQAPAPELNFVVAETEGEARENTMQTPMQMQPLGTDPTGPQLYFTATGPGYVYTASDLFVLTGSTRPWAIQARGGALQHDNGSAKVTLSNVEVRDAASDVDWLSLDGTPMWQNPDGNPEQYVQLEFRINVSYAHVAGHYQGDVVLEWGMPPMNGMPATGGTIPVTLHLDVPEMLSASLEGNSLTIPTDTRDAGWARSDSEVTLEVNSNGLFDLRMDAGPDLANGDASMPTALRVRQIAGDGEAWDVWGDLGDSAHGQSEPPWTVSEAAGSPWPGTVVSGVGAPGITAVGISAAAWRSGYDDPKGQYTSSIVITVSLP